MMIVLSFWEILLIVIVLFFMNLDDVDNDKPPAGMYS